MKHFWVRKKLADKGIAKSMRQEQALMKVGEWTTWGKMLTYPLANFKNKDIIKMNTDLMMFFQEINCLMASLAQRVHQRIGHM